MSNATHNQANTILAQLRADGPLGTLAAVGARGFTSSEREGNAVLTFQITIQPRTRHYIEVELTVSDTYTVRLVRVPMRGAQRFSRIVEGEREGIYADQLAATVYGLGTPN